MPVNNVDRMYELADDMKQCAAAKQRAACAMAHAYLVNYIDCVRAVLKRCQPALANYEALSEKCQGTGWSMPEDLAEAKSLLNVIELYVGPPDDSSPVSAGEGVSHEEEGEGSDRPAGGGSAGGHEGQSGDGGPVG